MGPKKNRGFHGNYVLTVDGQQHPPTVSSKKKKNPKNAFFFYMQDFREAQETRGIFYKTQKEVAEAAASSWQYLTDDERKPYQDAAKEAKEKDKADLHNKFTTEGRSYADVNKEEQDRRDRQEKILHEIRSTIRSLRTSPALNNYPFHIIHVNYYCKTNSGLYVPCELAVAEFTLLDGVKRLLRTLINPGELPLGYKYDAEKHSQETHKLPMPCDLKGEGVVQDYASIFQCLQAFLRESKAEYKLPPLYTIDSQLEPCENVLTMLCDSVNEDNIFRVFPAKEMFFELQHACVDIFQSTDASAVKLPFVSVAQRELEKDIFDYTKGLACAFHEETDAIPYCSSSCTQRWSFLILDYCHQVTKMSLIPGRHVPRHIEVSQYKKLKQAVEQKKPDDVAKLKQAVEQKKPDDVAKLKQAVEQKKSDDVAKLNSTMQKMNLASPSGQRPYKQTAAYAEALRSPKQVSEAIDLLSPDEKDEFPPLGS